VRRAFKYRIWTNKTQERALGEMLETHRRLYNACLEERKVRYEEEKVSVTYRQQSAQFTQQRKTNSFYARLNALSGHTTIKRLDLAFEAFFRRVKAGEKPGYPRFKGREFFDSITFAQYRNGVKLENDRLYVQHVGVLRIKLHRPVEGMIKMVILKREAGKWYAVFSCDLGDVQVEPSQKPSVGIDLGLTRFFTTSNNERDDDEPNPRYLKDALPELRRAQRAVSRKKRGGSNRRKAVGKVRKLHVDVKNQRKEHHHQAAIRLLDKYGKVCVEKLDIREMVAEGKHSRSIVDAGWGGFISTVKYKAEKLGAEIIEVEPRGTSQECSGCGEIVPKTLRDRRHICPKCGLDLDRDHNAARNILRRGLARTGPAGRNAGDGLHAPRSLPRKENKSKRRQVEDAN
jgi:putative transposase